MQKMVVVTPNSWNRCFHFTSLNIDARLHIVLSHVLRQRRQRSLWVCDCNCNSGVSQEVILLSSFPRLQGHECARNAARLYTFVTSETFAQVFLSGHCHGLLCLWLTGSRLSFSAGDVIMAVGLAADGIVVNVCLQWHTHTEWETGSKGGGSDNRDSLSARAKSQSQRAEKQKDVLDDRGEQQNSSYA